MHNGGNLLRPLRYKNIQILRNPKQHVSWLTVDADIVSNNYQTKLAHREYRTKHQITEIRLVTNWKQKSGPSMFSYVDRARLDHCHEQLCRMLTFHIVSFSLGSCSIKTNALPVASLMSVVQRSCSWMKFFEACRRKWRIHMQHPSFVRQAKHLQSLTYFKPQVRVVQKFAGKMVGKYNEKVPRMRKDRKASRRRKLKNTTT